MLHYLLIRDPRYTYRLWCDETARESKPDIGVTRTDLEDHQPQSSSVVKPGRHAAFLFLRNNNKEHIMLINGEDKHMIAVPVSITNFLSKSNPIGFLMFDAYHPRSYLHFELKAPPIMES